jgi:hypothetical protein
MMTMPTARLQLQVLSFEIIWFEALLTNCWKFFHLSSRIHIIGFLSADPKTKLCSVLWKLELVAFKCRPQTHEKSLKWLFTFLIELDEKTINLYQLWLIVGKTKRLLTTPSLVPQIHATTENGSAAFWLH